MKILSVERLDNQSCLIPLLGRNVPAGFPSPADDYLDGELDLGAYLIEHPASTFMLTVDGPSMIGAGIHSGDKIAVDRSLTPAAGMIVVGVVHGEMTIKRLVRWRGGHHYALAAEPAADSQEQYPPIIIDEGSGVEIWGVVIGSPCAAC